MNKKHCHESRFVWNSLLMTDSEFEKFEYAAILGVPNVIIIIYVNFHSLVFEIVKEVLYIYRNTCKHQLL